MSRFHLALTVAVIICAVGWLFKIWLLAFIAIAGLVILIGFGVATPRLSLFGSYVCRGSGIKRCVALTFDDGPDAASTPALLELLKESGVQAAFFCIGKHVAANPALAARIVQEGHLLQNHSYNHDNFTALFTMNRLRDDLVRAQSVIEEKTGVAPGMFRPPIGHSTPRTFRAARALGLLVVGWTVRGFDTITTDPQLIVSRIAERLSPGAIILLHDGNIPADRLLATVKLLLDRLRTLGYEVVRLDHLLT